MVKRCLRNCETRKNFQFTTLLAEIEAILNLNSTYVYEDIESGLMLISAHFLVANLKLGPSSAGDADCYEDEGFQLNIDSASKLNELWRKGRSDLGEKEHLLRLRERIPLEHKLCQSNLNPKLEVQ